MIFVVGFLSGGHYHLLNFSTVQNLLRRMRLFATSSIQAVQDLVLNIRHHAKARM